MAVKFKHVACAISGGVDSAVAAWRLVKHGFKVTGIFMRNWDANEENDEGYCSQAIDLEFAKLVCRTLKIEFVEANFVRQYWHNVFMYMVSAYKAGTTPNPDVLCNRHIKFDAFFRFASDYLGADAIATGHYARSSFGDFLQLYDEQQACQLLLSNDAVKDQTLFLCRIPQFALRRCMFPVGGIKKTDVKRIARSIGLDVIARKPESHGICFIGTDKFSAFIDKYVEEAPGLFIDFESGKVLGQHNGVHHWTVGQRAHISGQRQQYYVLHRDAGSQKIVVVAGKEHPALFSCAFYCRDAYWISYCPEQLQSPHCPDIYCLFRFQHGYPLIECRVRVQGTELFVQLCNPQRAITCGQFAVFYDCTSQACLGSAVIHRVVTPHLLGNLNTATRL